MLGARDGQLKINRGGDSPPWALQTFDDELGLWLTLAQADDLEDAMRAGIPVLRGPYVVDYTDILHDTDAHTLWTPESGDVLLALYGDLGTFTSWAGGGLNFGTEDNPELFASGWTGSPPQPHPFIGYWLLTTTSPIQVQYADPAAHLDATEGHVELYALVARAVAP